MTKILVAGLSRPAFADDSERELAKNGRPALAAIVSRQTRMLNQIAHSGFPCYAWISDGDELGGAQVHRQVYLANSLGAVSELAHIIYMPFSAADPSAFTTGQGVTLDVGGTSAFRALNSLGGLTGISLWPESAMHVGVETAFGDSGAPVEMTITREEDNGPLMASGIFAQAGQYAIDSTGLHVGSSDEHSKGDIVGRDSLGSESLFDFDLFYQDTFRNRRPQFGWCDPRSGSYVDFTTSKTNFRYIFDQSYGTSGTSFSAGGPAATLPLMYTAGGRDTQVKVYVFINAAMSGTTDTGTIGVANKNSSGTMASSASALTNASTISGTTFAWYPSLGSFDLATSQYFLAYAGSTPDRVALCAKSSGSTDSVRIRAWTMIVRPVTG